MNAQRAALVQAVLEGVPLPATRAQLLEYADAQEPSIVADLRGLPDAKFVRLDEVGELLTMRPTAPVPPEHDPARFSRRDVPPSAASAG